jgi:hypothetical protein
MDKKSIKRASLAAKLILFTPALLLLLFGAYLSFRWALADILVAQVRYQLEKAQTEEQPLDAKQWLLARQWLENAMQLHPDYSDYLEMAAFFYYVAGIQPKALLDELGWHDNQEKTLAYARRALRIRPSWPYLWNELILSKVALKQFDGELTGALERAVTLGPWEESVLEDIAFTGLDQWNNFEKTAQKWILVAMDKFMEINKNSDPLINELATHENFGKICDARNEVPNASLKMLDKSCKSMPSAN